MSPEFRNLTDEAGLRLPLLNDVGRNPAIVKSRGNVGRACRQQVINCVDSDSAKPLSGSRSDGRCCFHIVRPIQIESKFSGLRADFVVRPGIGAIGG